jgi:hypothetical protein
MVGVGGLAGAPETWLSGTGSRPDRGGAERQSRSPYLGTVGGVTGPEPGDLAVRLLVAQRALARLDVPPEVRIKFNLRFMAICTSLKLPGASPASCARRLDRLMAEAEQAERPDV